MFRGILRALVLSMAGVAWAGGPPLSAFLEPQRLPLLPKAVSFGEDEQYLFAPFQSQANGSAYGPFEGTHSVFSSAKPQQPRPAPRPPVMPGPRPNPLPRPGPNPVPPPVRPPVRPPPRYNVPPKRVSLPPSPLPSPIGATLVPWMQIVGAGDDGYASPGSPPVRPLEEGFELEAAWLHTETGATIPLSVTLIQDLTLLPTTLDLGQGPIVIDWGDFSEFTSTSGRYLLLRADVRLDVLFLPEPSSAAALLMGMAAMCWAGRRARR